MRVGEPFRVFDGPHLSVPPGLGRFLAQDLSSPLDLTELPPTALVHLADSLVRRNALIQWTLDASPASSPRADRSLNDVVEELFDVAATTTLLLAAVAAARGLDVEVRMRLEKFDRAVPAGARELATSLFDLAARDLAFDETLLSNAPDTDRARSIRELAIALDAFDRGTPAPPFAAAARETEPWPDVELAAALLRFEQRHAHLEEHSAIVELIGVCRSLVPKRSTIVRASFKAAMEPYLQHIHTILEASNVTGLRGAVEDIRTRFGLLVSNTPHTPRAHHLPLSNWQIKAQAPGAFTVREPGVWLVVTDPSTQSANPVEARGVSVEDVVARLDASRCAALMGSERVEVPDAEEPRRRWVLYFHPRVPGAAWALRALHSGSADRSQVVFEWAPALVVGRLANVDIIAFQRWATGGTSTDLDSLDAALRSCVALGPGMRPLGHEV